MNPRDHKICQNELQTFQTLDRNDILRRQNHEQTKRFNFWVSQIWIADSADQTDLITKRLWVAEVIVSQFLTDTYMW